MAGVKKSAEIVELLYNTGSHASPSWSVIPTVKDIDYEQTINQIEIDDHDSDEMEYINGKFDRTISFQMSEYVSDTVYDALQTNWLAKTPVNIGFADGPNATSGTIIEHRDFNIANFHKRAPANGHFAVDVEFKPAATGNRLTKITVP